MLDTLLHELQSALPKAAAIKAASIIASFAGRTIYISGRKHRRQQYLHIATHSLATGHDRAQTVARLALAGVSRRTAYRIVNQAVDMRARG